MATTVYKSMFKRGDSIRVKIDENFVTLAYYGEYFVRHNLFLTVLEYRKDRSKQLAYVRDKFNRKQVVTSRMVLTEKTIKYGRTTIVFPR
jgi:hypothetical protein